MNIPRMQPTLQNPKNSNCSSEAKPPFNVVMVYEDTETGQRAMVAFQCLTDHLCDDFLVSNNLWNLDLLRSPKVREAAAHEAAEADMIIVSLHGNHDLPDVLKAWIRKWLAQRKGREGALVALLDSAAPTLPTASRSINYLKEIAARAQIDFFSHSIENSSAYRAMTMPTVEPREIPLMPQTHARHSVEAIPAWL